MRAGVAVLLVAFGCAPRAGKPPPGNLFPTGRFTDEALRGACPVQVDALRNEWDLRPEGPPPMVGAHPRRVLLDIRERSGEIEVAALAVDAQTSAPVVEAAYEDDDAVNERYHGFAAREAIYAGFRGSASFPEVELWLGDESEVTVRVLLRRRVQGGLFDSLSYCFESYEYATIAPGTSYARLVVDEPTDGTSEWIALEQY